MQLIGGARFKDVGSRRSYDDSAAIISRLIDVCSKGQDASIFLVHQLLLPEWWATRDSFLLSRKHIQWAVDTFLNGSISYPSAACSHHLINNPLPYHVVPLYYQTVQVNKPEQCVCDNIVKYRFQYLHSGLSTARFCAVSYRYTKCYHFWRWPESVDRCLRSECLRYFARPVTLPYQFACNQVCANCQQLTSSYISFKSTYPNAHLHPNYLTLMQSYMNSDLGMNLTALEYMDFLYDSCGYTDFLRPMILCPCLSLKRSQVNLFKVVFKSKNLLELFNVTIPAKS